MCKGSNTTTTSTQANPAAMNAYNSLLGRASDVASTPYQAYTGDLVAPINAQQQTGISNINSSAGFAQPFIQQAAGFATNAAQPLTAAQIQQYQSPYTQNVVDATTNWFNNQNQQQQQNVLGNAAAQGALGGDRVGVAQANLAAQQTASQAPVIAGLYNQGYQQALGVAQQQQQNQANAAYSLGNLGVAGQNAALTGANAQIGAGTLEQQNQQQLLSALYGQYQLAQAFPYQQTQWLAGIDTGVGSQLGGTSTTTPPTPNPIAQYGGLGLAAAGLFLRRGGGVKGFAAGGTPYGTASGWIPSMSITMGRGAPAAPGVPSQAPPMDLTKAGLAFAQKAQKHDWSGSDATDLSPSGVSGFSPSSVGSTYSLDPGGLSGGLGGIYRSGGGVRGFALGGSPDFDDAFAQFPVPRATAENRALAVGLADTLADRGYSPNDITLDSGVPLPRPRPFEAPPRLTDVDPNTLPPSNTPTLGDAGVMSMAPRTDASAGFEALPDTVPARGVADVGMRPGEAGGGEKAFGLGLIPSDIKMPLLAAGLGMLASRSPNLGNAIGEGGLQGLGTYSQQKQQDIANAQKGETISQQNRRLDMELKRLDQAADQSRRQLAENTRHNLATEQQHLVPAGYRKAADGSLEAIPGGPHDPTVIKAGADAKRGTAGLLDEDTISDMAGQYLAGDKSVMQNLGRGAQGAENIVKLRAEISRQARDAGLKPDQVATKMADFAGRTAAMRSLGTRGVNVEYAANTANKAIDLAQEAYGKLPRNQFVPFNQLRQLYDTKTSSPEQAAAFTAVNTLVNEYARVAAGGSNQATEGMRQHAREMLNTAMDHGAFNAVLGMMRREIHTAKSAYNETRQEFLADHSTAPQGGAKAPAAPTRSTADQQALDWAAKNPNDPRATEIKKRLGVQ